MTALATVDVVRLLAGLDLADFDAPRVFADLERVNAASALFRSERVPERLAPRPDYAELPYADVMVRELHGGLGFRRDETGRLRAVTASYTTARPVAAITERARVETVEGPRWRLEVAPGVVAVRSSDPVRRERAAERQRESAEKDLALREALAGTRVCGSAAVGAGECFPGCSCGGYWTPPVGGVSRIACWSAKSRSRMVQRLAELDYTPLLSGPDGEPLVPAMVTLTYPGDWLAVAPSSSVARRHVELLRKRWARRWGTPLLGVWKREFQRRGAPHYHVLCVPPADPEFASWLSGTWAEIVDADWCGLWCWQDLGPLRPQGPACRSCSHPSCCRARGQACCEYGRHVLAGTGVDYNDGARVLDPKRLAIYFAKHGSFAEKEYQNGAPAAWLHEDGCDDRTCEGCSAAGIGRFWGVWGLRRAVVAVEVAPDVAATVRRVMRRHSQANRYYVPGTVWRKRYSETLDTSTGELLRSWRWRKRRSLHAVEHVARPAGFLLVNDGPGFVAAVARLVDRQHRFQPARRLSDGRVWKSGAGLGPVGILP